MTAPRRGLSNERHTRLKLGIAALSLAGFAAGWALFATTNQPATATAQAAIPTATVKLGTATKPTPVATATRRPRLSRGS